MPEYDYVTVNVFTDQRFGGNPLAVLPRAAGLSDAAMQSIARDFNLSETTFVLPPNDPAHTARVRIFTPLGELPFAGHPNVGTAFVLARAGAPGEAFLFEEAAGLVSVRLDRQAGAVVGAEVAAPATLTLGASVPVALAAALAGLDETDIVTGAHAPVVASVGAPFLVVEVAPAALTRARPVMPAFDEAAALLADELPRPSLHLYARDAADPVRIAVRVFAPLLGIPEDPATGASNAAMAALLTSLAPGEDVSLAFDITQGVEMGRPSRLLATGSKTAETETRASIAGRCVLAGTGRLDIS